MQKFITVFAATTAASLGLALPAKAITQEAGFIESNLANSTIDLWYFTLNVDSLTGIQADPRAGIDPLSIENMSLILYENDGMGGIGTQLASDGAAAPLPGNARVELNLLAGDYVVALSAYDLIPAEVGGPFQTDSTVPLTFEYEITLDQAGGNESVFTCSIEGNLDGSFTQNGTNCALPPMNVAEPGSFALLGLGLIGLAGWRRRA